MRKQAGGREGIRIGEEGGEGRNGLDDKIQKEEGKQKKKRQKKKKTEEKERDIG